MMPHPQQREAAVASQVIAEHLLRRKLDLDHWFVDGVSDYMVPLLLRQYDEWASEPEDGEEVVLSVDDATAELPEAPPATAELEEIQL